MTKSKELTEPDRKLADFIKEMCRERRMRNKQDICRSLLEFLIREHSQFQWEQKGSCFAAMVKGKKKAYVSVWRVIETDKFVGERVKHGLLIEEFSDTILYLWSKRGPGGALLTYQVKEPSRLWQAKLGHLIADLYSRVS